MKQLQKSQLIHIWQDYEFFLHIPHNFDGSNKPFVFYYYQDSNSGKRVRIRKYVPKHNGNRNKIKESAKKLINDIIELLERNWNPLENRFDEVEITSKSTILECIDDWLRTREVAFKNQSLKSKRLKNWSIVMTHFKDYLTAKRMLSRRATSIGTLDIKQFMEHKAFERGWNKVSFNCYLIDVGTFFNYLVDKKVIKENPVKKIMRKSTKHDSSRFKVYELDELSTVADLLYKDPAFVGLYLASKLLFKYNIRPIEITRIQVQDIDWKDSLLTLPASKTKNGNEARFSLDSALLEAIHKLAKNATGECYIFGKRNKPSANQTFADYFGQRWRAFRKKYSIPSHLKLYALKHTANYYDIMNGASYEEIRQRNRHSNLQVTTLYVKERLFKKTLRGQSLICSKAKEPFRALFYMLFVEAIVGNQSTTIQTLRV